jgi:hypothetical protein
MITNPTYCEGHSLSLLQLGKIIRLTFGRMPHSLLHDCLNANISGLHPLASHDCAARDSIFDKHSTVIGMAQERERAILRGADACGAPVDDVAHAETVVHAIDLCDEILFIPESL